MLQHALDGYAKAFTPHNLMTFVPALNNMWAFASLCELQGRANDARHWYLQALQGYQRTFGLEHDKCQPLRDKLAALARVGEALYAPPDKTLTAACSPGQTVANSSTLATKPASRRQRLFNKLARKQKQR
jgi:hypothetical protein